MIVAPQALEGRFVRLEPFTPSLKEEVRAAVDADPDAWLLFQASFASEAFYAAWDRRLADMAAGTWVSYAVRLLADGVVVGTTSYLNIRRPDFGLEVGATYYRPDARGGAVNPECKLLMLGQAFGFGAMRVELVTDARNLRSQAAIAKLGAVREGTLRNTS